MSTYVLFPFIAFLSICCNAYGFFDPRGKVDLGPAYVHIDVLESNKTIKKMDLAAVRTDATILLIKDQGWCLKPSLLYGCEQGDRNEAASAGIAIGHCFPFKGSFSITPSLGVTWGYVRTTIHLPFPNSHGSHHFRETFRSISTFLSLDATYSFCKKWRICAIFQYSWSRTHTKITEFLTSRSNAKGPNYAALLEYDFNDHWTGQLGGAYNIGLSKEKHGIRAAGVKIGLAYWF